MKPYTHAKFGLAATLALGSLFTVLLRGSRPAMVQAAGNHPAQGAELFASSGCAHCHGADGQGTDRGPGLHNLRKKMSKAKVYDQIAHGGQGMPAFGESLKGDQIYDLVAFLRAKKWITPPSAPTPPASPAGSGS